MGMAEAVGLTRIVTAPADTLAGACLDAGKPAIMMELASARMVRESEVDLAVQGTINILSHLGIVEEEKRPVDTLVIPGIHNSLPALRAARGGIIHYAVEPGVFLRAGTVIARVYDVFGSQLEAITMAQDAYVSTFPPMSWVGAQAVASGDFVADLFAAAEDFS
jgi:predicted deacylase